MAQHPLLGGMAPSALHPRGWASWGAYLGAVILALATGCATLAPLPVHVSRTLPLGLNAGFHAPLSGEVVIRFCNATIRTPQLSVAGLLEYYASTAACPSLHSIILVEGPDVGLVSDLVPLLHPGDTIELGNELELPPHNLTPSQYADFIGHTCLAGAITGGVYTLNADTKQRMLLAHAACPEAKIGLHLYEDLTVDDLRWIASVNAHFVITEAGSPTRCTDLAGQKQWIADRQALLSTIPNIDLLVIYQHPVGPTCSALDTFGIAGHPAEDLFK